MKNSGAGIVNGQIWQNRLHTLLLVLAMTLYSGFVTTLTLGPGYLPWVAVFIAVILLSLPKIPVVRILNKRSVSPLNADNSPVLHRLVSVIADRAGLSIAPELYYQRSPVPNAVALGQPDAAAVVVTSGLLSRLSLPETAGVLAHEISHIANRDLQVLTLANIISQFTIILAVAGLGLVILSLPFWALGWVNYSIPGILILILTPWLTLAMHAALSRTREFSADLMAAQLTGDPVSLAVALTKLENIEVNWLQKLLQGPRKALLPDYLRTHPPTLQRVERLKQISRSPELLPEWQDKLFPPVSGLSAMLAELGVLDRVPPGRASSCKASPYKARKGKSQLFRWFRR